MTDTHNHIIGHKSGFTLIEVVVAMALLGFSLIATFTVLNRCAVGSFHARRMSQAMLVAERILNEIRLGDRRAFVVTEGTEAPFVWQSTIRSTDFENLGAVSVVVSWTEQNRTQAYQLVSFVQMKPLDRG
ncbi:MAG: type II secretion system protein [Planctomycetes bacterium]|nr:type II secretion system protein [Planctomycetota bacterium]